MEESGSQMVKSLEPFNPLLHIVGKYTCQMDMAKWGAMSWPNHSTQLQWCYQFINAIQMGYVPYSNGLYTLFKQFVNPIQMVWTHYSSSFVISHSNSSVHTIQDRLV